MRSVNSNTNCSVYFCDELKSFVRTYEKQILDTYYSNRFWNNNVNKDENRTVFMCFCCFEDKYTSTWKFNSSKNYLKGFDKRNKKFFGLTICSSYKGMCKHIGTHKIQFERIAKRRTMSDYIGLFVDLSVYLTEYIWNGKRDLLLMKEKLKCCLVLDECEQSTINFDEDKCGLKAQYEAMCTLTPQKHKTHINLKRGRSCGPHLKSAEPCRTKNNASVNNGYMTPKRVRNENNRELLYDSLDNDMVVWGKVLFPSTPTCGSFENTATNLHEVDRISTNCTNIGICSEDPLPFSNK